jgi:hypothetical protein
VSNFKPGSKEWKEEREERRKAADAWLRLNPQTALVVPTAVARDLFPGGYGEKEWAPYAPEIMPGHTVEMVEIGGNHTFVILKRS